MKFTEWTELDIDLFKEIFLAYWTHQGNLDNMVMEIQNPSAIAAGSPEVRVFFGNKIHISDYKLWNLGALEMMTVISSTISKITGETAKSLDDCEISMCIFENGPRIIPTGAVNSHLDIIMATCFGIIPDDDKINKELTSISKNTRNLGLWYYKKDGKIIIDPNNLMKDCGFEKKIRVRTIPFSDWAIITSDYISNNFRIQKDMVADDLKREEVIVREY